MKKNFYSENITTDQFTHNVNQNNHTIVLIHQYICHINQDSKLIELKFINKYSNGSSEYKRMKETDRKETE